MTHPIGRCLARFTAGTKTEDPGTSCSGFGLRGRRCGGEPVRPPVGGWPLVSSCGRRAGSALALLNRVGWPPGSPRRATAAAAAQRAGLPIGLAFCEEAGRRRRVTGMSRWGEFARSMASLSGRRGGRRRSAVHYPPGSEGAVFIFNDEP